MGVLLTIYGLEKTIITMRSASFVRLENKSERAALPKTLTL